MLPARASRRQAPLASRRPPALWRQLDWLLVASVLALLGVGMLLVWSATLHRDDLTGGDTDAYLRKQGINAAIGLVLAAVVAATDYIRQFPDMIRPFVTERPYVTLGTDGYGRSDWRRVLREFFEVDRRYVALAALRHVAPERAPEAIERYGIETEGEPPWRR